MSLHLRDKRVLFAFLGVSFIFMLGLYVFSSMQQIPIKQSTSTVKTIRYSFELSNKANAFIEDSSFYAFAPVAETSSQKVISLKANKSYELETDRYGNQVMKFQLKNLAPYSKRTITVTAEVAFFDQPRELSDKNWMTEGELFLSPERFIESDSDQIQNTALKILNNFSSSKDTNSNHSLALITHNWVANHLEYAGYTKKDYGALYALENQLGDCTEYMYLFTALMRAQNIKSHGFAGFRVEGNSGLLRADEYHNWSTFLDEENIWRIADPLNNVFDKQYSKYLAFRVLAPDELKTMSNTHRFLAFDQRLKVTMM